ncbi:MAG TPA: MiaB/RimO family radical SAM methylthiotransferase, partial [Firmicutes bacterium]|nr:MiaB/RimO family radical SAM methylthiotransferase [Bacillota bacterium]
VRGRERSRNPEEILKEITLLAEQGYLEVTLLGQNVNSYGRDLPGGIDFADLLARVDRETGIKRIRFMTSHPRDFTAKLAETMARGKNICPHLHLPVQAGSNRILDLMNRGYTREHYLEQVSLLREILPGCAITTDLIVGFPGETEADFLETLDLVERVSFDAAFTFMYSRRSGTPAAGMPNQVPAEVKKERLQRLIALQNKHSLRHNEALVGRTVEVLVDGPSKTDPTVWSGKTGSNKTVNFSGRGIRKGQLLPVVITEAKTWSLTGRICLDSGNAHDSAI